MLDLLCTLEVSLNLVRKTGFSKTNKMAVNRLNLAYGGWARSAIGSQNFGVPTKRYDDSLFLRR